jgi:hypothetical protein
VLVLCALASLPLAACGATVDRPSSAPSSTSSTTSLPPTTDSSADSTSVPGASVPDDPAALQPCDDLPANALASMPSRRWVDAPPGWAVRYATTSGDLHREPPSTRASSMVRVSSAGEISATVSLTSQDQATGSDVTGERRTSIRGTPASIEAEVNRGGQASGVTLVGWDEAGRAMLAATRGLDPPEIRSVLGRVQLVDGRIGRAPTGWRLLGTGSTVVPGSMQTVIGLSSSGAALDPYGAAPLTVVVGEQVDAHTADPDSAQVPEGDLRSSSLRLTDVAGRPAIAIRSPDGSRTVIASAEDGREVEVQAAAGVDLGDDALGAIAASVRPIPTDDPRLVGVPMGQGASGTAGASCREG